MQAYSIGFAKKNPEAFFGLLRRIGIRRVGDIRPRNPSQLAGFTKKEDLSCFPREMRGAEYRHEPLLAPMPSWTATRWRAAIGPPTSVRSCRC